MVQVQFPHLILKTLYANASARNRILPYLTSDWFRENQNISTIVEKIVKYVEKYNNFPNVIESRNFLRTDQAVLEEFDAAINISDEECNTECILDDIEDFIRKKLIYQVTLDAQEWLFKKHKEDEEVPCFSQMMADAEAFTFQTEIGLDLIDDLDEVKSTKTW